MEATCKKLKRSSQSIGGKARSLGVQVKRSVTIRLRSEKMRLKTSSTPAVDKILKDHYLDTNINQLSIRIKRSETFVKTRLRQLGLKIPKSVIKQRILASRIKPGNVPPNKGKTWDRYIDKDVQEKLRKTTFKKGNLPQNTLSDGVITLRRAHSDRGAPPYYWIRISQGVWKMLHVFIWEKANGPVPAGHIITFKDKNTKHCVLSNLQCITRAQHCRNNWNRDKASAAMLKYWEGGGNLKSDKYIAFLLASKDKGLRELIINDKQLIAIKRHQVTLQRKLKKHENSK